jgi:long-subunit fatty acid transport protein
MKRSVNPVIRRRGLSAALVLAFLGSALYGAVPASAQIGGAGVVFLKIEPDSRAAGMGNAGVALADNASAMFWNPAGLGFQTGTEAGITHSNWLPEFTSDLFYEHLVAKHHVNNWGTFGAHLTFLNLGSHEGRDHNNISTGTFKSYDLAMGVSYGVKVSSRFSVGTSLRFIYSNLAPGQTVDFQPTKAGVSTAVDIAGLYRSRPIMLGSVPTTVSAGFNLANMGPKIRYSDSDNADPIPTNLRFGTALTFDFDEYNALNLVLDFNKDLIDVDSTGSAPFYKAIFSSWRGLDVNLNTSDPTDIERVGVLRQITIGTGMEYWYDRLLALRFGYFYEDPYNGNREFLTLGAGIRYNIIGVDFSYIYALEEGSPLANTMRFSLLVNFAG